MGSGDEGNARVYCRVQCRVLLVQARLAVSNAPFSSVSTASEFPHDATVSNVPIPPDAEQVMAQEFRIDGDCRVRVDVPSAHVRLRPSSRDDRVVITVLVANHGSVPPQDVLDRWQLSTRQVKDVVKIESDANPQEEGAAWWSWVRQLQAVVYLDVTVPHSANVDVNAAGGRVDAEGIRGDVSVECAGGSVRVCDVKGPLAVRVQSCDVVVSGIDAASVDLTVSAGTLRVENVASEALTVNAYATPVTLQGIDAPTDVTVHGASATLSEVRARLTASVRGGTLTVDGVEQDAECTAYGGSVTASVADRTGATLDFVADEIDLDEALVFRGDREDTHLSGRLRDGGSNLQIRAVRGKIHCRRR